VIALMQVAARSSAQVRMELWGDLGLGNPVFLAGIPLVLLALWFGRGRGGRPTLRVPLGHSLSSLPISLRQRFLFVPGLLEVVAGVLLMIALARPLNFNILQTVTSEGVDIVLALDRSGSMRFKDLDPGRTRLEVAKDVVGDFAERRMTDQVGASDNVALLSFAGYPELRCPFTLDVDALRGFLDKVEMALKEEDGTALGAALAKASTLLEESGGESRVVVLLTDGENTRDDILPEEGLRIAKEYGVRVYTIHAARSLLAVDIYGRVVDTGREPDTSLLEQIARETDGRFYRARDLEGLEQIYAEIEELERTPRIEERRVETRDLYPKVLLLALALGALGRTLSAFGLRRTT
jgi:Ca-activated chloride channel homolog